MKILGLISSLKSWVKIVLGIIILIIMVRVLWGIYFKPSKLIENSPVQILPSKEYDKELKQKLGKIEELNKKIDILSKEIKQLNKQTEERKIPEACYWLQTV